MQKTDGQLDTLERLVHDLEFVQIEKQVQIFFLSILNIVIREVSACCEYLYLLSEKCHI